MMDSNEPVAEQSDVSGASPLGWYNFLKERMQFPFAARCHGWRAGSPLRLGDEVEVIELSEPQVGLVEIRMDVRWEGKVVAVPLSQLAADGADVDTKRAIADWYYWHGLGPI